MMAMVIIIVIIFTEDSGFSSANFNPNDIFNVFFNGGSTFSSTTGRGGHKIVFNFGGTGNEGYNIRGGPSSHPFSSFFN